MTCGSPKLIVVIASLDPGGGERVCLNLSNFWAREDKAVDLVILRHGGQLINRVDPKVNLVRLNATRTLSSIGKLAWRLRQSPQSPVLAFGGDVGAVLAVLKSAKLISNPIIYREGSSPRHKKGDWIYRHLVARTDGIIVATKATHNVLREMADSPLPPVLLCPNPADPRWVPGDASANTREPLKMLAVGRLEPVKGYRRLLLAFQRIRAMHPNARLTIAGEGGERPHIEHDIHALGLDGAVHLAGFVENLNPLYAEAGIVVMASLYEGQPNALCEAIVRGRAVVASGGETVRELLGALGLSDSFVDESDGDFIGGFCRSVQRVMSADPGRIDRAARMWRDATDFGRVAGRYWQFCQSREDSSAGS